MSEVNRLEKEVRGLQEIIRKQRVQIRSMSEDEKTCLQCSQPYMPKRSDGKYCSVACRQKAWTLVKIAREGDE